MFRSVDSALYGLFDIAAKSPLTVKSIFFGDGCKVDANSIRKTADYDRSRIPTERITLARETLSRCYDSIDEQLSALFFLYNYGFLNDYGAQLIGGIAILTNEHQELIQSTLTGYRSNRATPIADIAAQHALEYHIANNKCCKIRKSLNRLRGVVWESTEDILLASGYLVYKEN